MALSMKDLKLVAKELNDKIEFDPKIKVVGVKKTDLADQIKAVCDNVVVPTEDEVSNDVVEMLEELECNPWPAPEGDAKQEPEEPEQAPEEQKEDKAEEAEEAETEPKEAKKKEKLQTRTPSGNNTGQSATQLVKGLIEAGTYSRKQIVDKLAEMGYKRVTPGTIISDALNPKYTKFDKTAVIGEDGCICFKE